MSKKKRKIEDAQVDLTPMIDVVFQLIIFFIVTITMQKEKNEDIRLERSWYGPLIEADDNPLTTTIEVDQRGWITMQGCPVSKQALANMLLKQRKRYGPFPIVIRGDKRTSHADIRSVMDLCTECGMWRINFMAVNKYASEK
jgi:biopolymer transport protein ExbD